MQICDKTPGGGIRKPVSILTREEALCICHWKRKPISTTMFPVQFSPSSGHHVIEKMMFDTSKQNFVLSYCYIVNSLNIKDGHVITPFLNPNRLLLSCKTHISNLPLSTPFAATRDKWPSRLTKQGRRVFSLHTIIHQR